MAKLIQTGGMAKIMSSLNRQELSQGIK